MPSVKNDNDREHIRYLMKNYQFEARFKSLLTQMQDILEALGILDKVTINTELLGQAVLNYFEDIDRLKNFEGYPVFCALGRETVRKTF